MKWKTLMRKKGINRAHKTHPSCPECPWCSPMRREEGSRGSGERSVSIRQGAHETHAASKHPQTVQPQRGWGRIREGGMPRVGLRCAAAVGWQSEVQGRTRGAFFDDGAQGACIVASPGWCLCCDCLPASLSSPLGGRRNTKKLQYFFLFFLIFFSPPLKRK